DAEVLIESVVLDCDECLRQVGRQLLQRDVGAGLLAAGRAYSTVDADNLDCRRTLGNLERLNRRQVSANPDHDAGDSIHGPQPKHSTPVDQPAESEMRSSAL